MKKLIYFLTAISILNFACNTSTNKDAEKTKQDSIAKSSSAQVTNTFTDSRNGKIYKTVKIGTQTWMAENLAYKASSGCWGWLGDESKIAEYGYLYNWETAKVVCPKGWHLPSDIEWQTLIDYLEGEVIAGCKLKEVGTTHWKSPNKGATNESGFTALPGGYRHDCGSFCDIGGNGYWWSSTECTTDGAWNRYMNHVDNNVFRSNKDKSLGYSVRCVKDN